MNSIEQAEHQRLVQETNNLIKKIYKHIKNMNLDSTDMKKLNDAIALLRKDDLVRNQKGVNKILSLLIQKYKMN